MYIIKSFFKAVWYLIKFYIIADILVWAGVGMGCAFTAPGWEEPGPMMDRVTRVWDYVFGLSGQGWRKFLNLLKEGFDLLVETIKDWA